MSKSNTKNQSKGYYVEIDYSDGYRPEFLNHEEKIEKIAQIISSFLTEEIENCKTIEFDDFNLAPEIQYQIVSMVKLYEITELSNLTGLMSFIANLKVLEDFKNHLSVGDYRKLPMLLLQMKTDDVLKLYRYFRTAYLKINGKFCNYELADLSRNMLSEFVDINKVRKKLTIQEAVEAEPEVKTKKLNDLLNAGFVPKHTLEEVNVFNKKESSLAKLITAKPTEKKKPPSKKNKKSVFDKNNLDQEFPEL